MDTQQIYDQVTERYSAASRGATAEYGQAVAKAFGYSEQELAAIPKESNMGLSCGNPLVLASIREVSQFLQYIPQTPKDICPGTNGHG